FRSRPFNFTPWKCGSAAQAARLPPARAANSLAMGCGTPSEFNRIFAKSSQGSRVREPWALLFNSFGVNSGAISNLRIQLTNFQEVRVLLSMTGYGEAHSHGEPLTLSVELRALNNRYLKVSLRAPDPYHLLEAEFEKVIRKTIKRGTIQIH